MHTLDTSIPVYSDPLWMRPVDIVGATLGLLVLSPLFVAIGIAIKHADSGPIFYRAVRVGRNNTVFRLYKFRSMCVDADCHGPGITTAGDTRVTSVGRWLRRTKLDELPQLLNVLLGEMSFVGPRPEDPRYVATYTPAQRQVLAVRPGITSAASIIYRHEEHLLIGEQWETTYRTSILPSKLAIDLDYLAHRTIWSDLGLLGRTVAALLR